jgi:hypothetical protein
VGFWWWCKVAHTCKRVCCTCRVHLMCLFILFTRNGDTLYFYSSEKHGGQSANIPRIGGLFHLVGDWGLCFVALPEVGGCGCCRRRRASGCSSDRNPNAAAQRFAPLVIFLHTHRTTPHHTTHYTHPFLIPTRSP